VAVRFDVQIFLGSRIAVEQNHGTAFVSPHKLIYNLLNLSCSATCSSQSNSEPRGGKRVEAQWLILNPREEQR
jgi:hypothetical protein